MSLKPTRYEYEAPNRIHGTPLVANTKLDVTQQGVTQWIATLQVSTTPANTAAEAQAKLREELTNLLAILGAGR
jgi:hypothetical protein